jgi:hypothetical protein
MSCGYSFVKQQTHWQPTSRAQLPAQLRLVHVKQWESPQGIPRVKRNLPNSQTLKISGGNEPELKQVIIAPVRCILVLGLKHLPKVYASTLQVQ